MQATSHAQLSTFPSPFGKYTLLGRLGVGGMAEVLLARQDVMGAGRLLAIKRLHPSLTEDAEARQMFLDEMRIVLGMRHPNIGHVMDVGEVDGALFLAMEHIEGRDLGRILRQVLRRGERFPLDVAVEVARQVCAALDHAHNRKGPDGKALGVVHRDVTPENVILTFDGNVKVVDFGIARANDRLTKTRTGLLKGTPAYMAPEQIQGKEIDGRADVFSLGALVYQITTGTHPFGDASGAGVLLRVLDVTPKSPSEIVADYPEDLERAVLGALEKDPDARWPDAASLAETLDAAVARNGWLVSPGRVSRWLTDLFPDAAKARSDLAADPSRIHAARASNYMGKTDDESGPVLPDLEALKAQLGEAGEDGATLQVSAEALWGKEDTSAEGAPAGEGSYVPSSLEMPPAPTTPPPPAPSPPAPSPPAPPSLGDDPLGAAHMDDAAGEVALHQPVEPAQAETAATAPARARASEAIDQVDTRVGRNNPPAPVVPPGAAPSAPAPSTEAWSLADHWNHLPAGLRGSWGIALFGAAASTAAILMGIGLLTLIGWFR